MTYLLALEVVALVLVVDLIFLSSYILNVRWYCDTLGVSHRVRPWWAR